MIDQLLARLEATKDRDEAATLRDEIVALAEAMPATPHDIDVRTTITEAALLWTRFAAAGGTVLFDSVGAKTIHHYPIDLPDGPDERTAVRDAVKLAFGWRDGELDAIEDRQARLSSNLPIKRAIAEGLLAECKASPVSLFRALYGSDTGLDHIDFVLTSTMLFVLVPRSHPDARATAWLERADAAVNSLQSIRFPAFGLYDRNLVDPDLITRIHSSLDLRRIPREVVERTLETMVMIVVREDVEKYLLHDVWGHSWQESLLELEWPMADLAADHRSATAEVLVVSENLADLIEFKYARQVTTLPLPSSSLLAHTPLRLDLSFADARRVTDDPAALHRIMTGVAALDGALTKLVETGDARYTGWPYWRCPPACLDLFALALGRAYEQHPDIWRLVDFARRDLGPALLALETALRN